MISALAILGALSLCGFLSARREWGVAWLACGLAATALILPCLLLPDGIPTPAASLGSSSPWRAAIDPAAGNPVLGDVTHQIQPWLVFLRSELRAGRWPFRNPHQFSGAPFWANGQSAPLFPLHLLFAALPLRVGFLLLPWLRIVIGGSGTWLFARELGLGRRGALVAALVYPLSGMLVGFLLFPMANALALVPWVLWTVERIAAGRAGAPALGAATGMLLLGGHPETGLHAAVLCAVYLVARGSERPARAWLSLASGWTLGAGLAAVVLAPFAAMLVQTSRWQSFAPGPPPPLVLLLSQPLRLVLPDLYGNPAYGTWWGPFNYVSTAVYSGAVALPLAVLGAGRARGDRRWLGVGAIVAFSFVAAYHLPGMRDLLASLPLIGRALHHRLIFGVELGVALFAGAGFERWLDGKSRGLVTGAAAVAALLAVAWWSFAGDWSARGLVATEAGWTLWALVAAASLLAGSRLLAERRAKLWPVVPLACAAELLAAHGRVNPALPLASFYTRTAAVEFLAVRPGRVAGVGTALTPNAATVYGLDDVRGDDTLKLSAYEALWAREFDAGHPTYFRPIERWNEPWLDRLGVRWVVTDPGADAPVAAWRLAHDGTDARVFERPGALPLARFEGDAANSRIRIADRAPGRWTIEWQSAARARLVVAETWHEGWSATDEAGRELAIEAVDGVLLGVQVGPGAGRVSLDYVPPGLAVGSAASVLSLAALLAPSLAGWRKRSAACS